MEKQVEEYSIPDFGYILIRDILLPNILGKETNSILYWAGKDLARKFPLNNLEEVIDFFSKAGWGTLSLIDQKKSELKFELTSEVASKRLKEMDNCSFQIEAGFLAQQIELQKKAITEAFEHPKKRSGKVIFTVKWEQSGDFEQGEQSFN